MFYITIATLGLPCLVTPTLSLSLSCSALGTSLSQKTCISLAAEARLAEMSTDRIKLKLHFGPGAALCLQLACCTSATSSSCSRKLLISRWLPVLVQCNFVLHKQRATCSLFIVVVWTCGIVSNEIASWESALSIATAIYMPLPTCYLSLSLSSHLSNRCLNYSRRQPITQ